MHYYILLHMRIWPSYVECPAERRTRSHTVGTSSKLHWCSATDDVARSTAPGPIFHRTADINCHVKTDNGLRSAVTQFHVLNKKTLYNDRNSHDSFGGETRAEGLELSTCWD